MLFAIGFACSITWTWSETAAEHPDTIFEEPITDSDLDHWSFRPIVRPRLPEIHRADWPHTPIDHFVLYRLEQSNIVPMGPASRTTLLRRLKFDILGLPPTPAEVIRFEQDKRPDAYERLVDGMLGSPAYGERWAQFWLDLARFAETDGFEHDKIREGAWQYRQWVIDALNTDMSYDKFVHDQLAGDLNGFGEGAIATTFCMAGPDMPDINEQDLRRHDKLNEITSTVGAVFLGLQMHCAQCHDHKYDPISHVDFFRLRGFFEAAIPKMKRDKPIYHLAAQTESSAPRYYFRGELKSPGPEVRPGPPRLISRLLGSDEIRESSAISEERNPRESLVDWIFSNDNPLTARVLANRIWQYHFGHSLCENPSDFGTIAGGPSHPQLLDWLASELRENHWSVKHLHRTILLSATYQQSSMVGPAETNQRDWKNASVVDPKNELYWKFPRKRLEGEAIRDALLAVSGTLNHQYGGPSVMPPLPPELTSTLLKGQWKTSERPADHARRSIYVFVRRNLRYPIFEVFDRPDAGATCARRDRSTTAIQALQMLNGGLVFEAAKVLRARLLDEAPDASRTQIVELLFLHTLSRRPSHIERERFTKALQSSADWHDNLLSACVAILNANEFVYID